jgi:putative endonuclease
MAEHIDLGKRGEQLTVEFLQKLGYFILERNWRLGKNEIDIIARDGKYIVVVEVKTRSSNQVAEPETAVTRDKQKALIRAANAYVSSKHIDSEVRFDIVSILIVKDVPKINHIPDAFYPMV